MVLQPLQPIQRKMHMIKPLPVVLLHIFGLTRRDRGPTRLLLEHPLNRPGGTWYDELVSDLMGEESKARPAIESRFHRRRKLAGY